MQIVAISDTHGCHRQLSLPTGDVLLHGGDVCDRGNSDQVLDFLQWFGSLDFQHKIFIAGNHDFSLGGESNGVCLIPAALPDSIVFLNNEIIEIEGLRIWGATTTPKGSPSNWDTIPRDIDILMTHYPPYKILDANPLGKHCGLKDLANFVHAHPPRVHLFGDIHASYGQKVIGPTQFMNASLYKASQKRIVNDPIVFEIEAQ